MIHWFVDLMFSHKFVKQTLAACDECLTVCQLNPEIQRLSIWRQLSLSDSFFKLFDSSDYYSLCLKKGLRKQHYCDNFADWFMSKIKV